MPPAEQSLEALRLQHDLHEWHELPGLFLRVTDVGVEQVPPPQKTARRAQEEFNKAFGKRESKAHGYLKWFGWCFAKGTPRYEAVIVFHGSYKQRYHQPSAGIDGIPFPYRGWNTWATLRCDVAWYGATFECGDVYNKNLVWPIAYGAVRQTYWLPFPDDICLADDWTFTEKPLAAFLIQRCKPTTFETDMARLALS